MPDPFTTHDVLNQPPLFRDVNLFTSDRALMEAVEREGGGHGARSLEAFGQACGSAEAIERGRLANENPPRLRSHDSQGRRIDLVEFHPAYHECMEMSFREGLHCSVWDHLAGEGGVPRAGAAVARAAGLYLAAQMEAGHCCPVTMTHAAVPVLLQSADLAREWLPKVLSRAYDRRVAPAWTKSSVTFGMGMTEKQGGTDVRANTTRASPAGSDGEYTLVGHKWFLSAPMSDAFFVLAQAPGGLTCFLVPRFRPDGSRNAIRLERLKDKLGNRSNASSEAEFLGAVTWRIGEEGRGVATIMDMVMATRLDCALSSAGLMRAALAHAIHHCEHRCAFGKTLVEQPLMRQVLADLALDVEAATALVFRLARGFDRAGDPLAAAWRRLMTPVTKYWVCKIAPHVVLEAMECMGGNAYTETLPLARIYREVPVNAIWEGAGNVMALDVLRVLQREPEIADGVMKALADAIGDDRHLRAAFGRVEGLLHDPRHLDARARTLVESLALVAAGAILRAHAPPAVADAFIATRLGGPFRETHGHGLDGADTKALIERASPARGNGGSLRAASA